MNARVLRLTRRDVDRFAAVSGDVNPLHTDSVYARRSPYGTTIAHGALGAIAALGALPGEFARRIDGLSLRFLRPILPEAGYAVEVDPADPAAGNRIAVTVTDRGAPALTVRASTGGRALPVPSAVPCDGVVRALSFEGLSSDPPLEGMLGTADPRGLRDLADSLGADKVPDSVVGLLAWSSWYVGMRIPGRDALFTALDLAPAESEPSALGRTQQSPRYDARVRRADPRTGSVLATADVTGGGAAATLRIASFLREPVPAPTAESIARFAPPGTALAQRTVLVVGGSRGLGAAVTAALASQGATVWVGYASSDAPVCALQREFGAHRVRGLRFDATDPGQVREALTRITDGRARLDGLVLAAAPPLAGLPLHPDSSRSVVDFVEDSLAMAVHPLSCAVSALAEAQGWTVLLSSAAVDDPPAAWGHYVAAKRAAESLVEHTAVHHHIKTLIVRAPKTRTDMTNTPTGRIGAIPAEQVAAAILAWVTDPATPPGPSVLSPVAITGSPIRPTSRVPEGAGPISDT